MIDNKTRTYGAANPALIGSVNGLKNGDAITASYNTAATATSIVGGYPIAAALSDPGSKRANYTVSNPGGTLSVTAASLVITANNAARPFGVANPAFSGSFDGAKNGESFTLSFTTTATSSSPLGAYPIVPSAAGPTLTNYVVTPVNGTLSVGAWMVMGFQAPVGDTNSVTLGPTATLPSQTSVWNTIKGGQTVPLKFNLFTAVGGTVLTNVSDVSSFALATVGCTAAPEDAVETDFGSTGGTALRSEGSQFVQNWQSPKGAGKCYRVTMQAQDGSRVTAFFKAK